MKHANRGRKPVFLQVAQELRNRILEGFLDEPQSIESMACLWHVSARTMRKAVRVLADQGIVDCKQGRKIRRAERGKPSLEPPAQRRFYDSVKERILNGAYRSGRPLPKVNYFVATDRVSPNTIAVVCAQLAKENLIHKIGKHWFVGMAPGQGSAMYPDVARRRPTVLHLFNFGMEWEPFYSSLWVSPFSSTLAAELRHQGWLTSMGFIMMSTWKTPDTGGLPIPAGAAEILAHAKSLKDSYQGTFVYFGITRYDTASECVQALLDLGKPVVLFDHNDRYEDFGRAFTGRRALPFFRCYFDEQDGIRTALQALTGLGHRKIGLPVSPAADWVPRRVARILDIARTITPAVSILTTEQREKFWQYDGGFNLALYSRHLLSSLTPLDGESQHTLRKRTSLRSLLKAHTPSLTTLLDQGVTALLCLNDAMAREIYLWATYVGLSIPRDISMISFDNRVDCQNFPVTTIDFGFARLGYLAAHTFIGDIPVKSGKNGNIPGPCTIVDRGSLAAPSDRIGPAVMG